MHAQNQTSHLTYLTIIGILCAMAWPAQAQLSVEPQHRPMPPSVTAEMVRKEVVRHAICRYITRHVPRDDIVYQPDADMEGSANNIAFVPAHITPPYEYDLSNFRIDLEIPLSDYAPHLAGDKRTRSALINAGTVTIENNEVLLNGEPLGWDSQALAAECQ